MGAAAEVFRERFVHRGGGLRRHGKLDDDYECFTAWPLVYLIGGDTALLDTSIEAWNGITRQWTYEHQKSVHREFVRHYDMLHLAEAYVGLQNFGLADPSIPEHVERACRFASFYTGQDPEAANYDAALRLIRSPMTGSGGPEFSSSADYVLNYGHATLHPVVKDLEPEWDKDPARHAEIQRLYDEVVVRGDVPMNLAITGLVAHAHILSGEERYRRWVLDYVDAWIDRTAANDGIIPDNVGLAGKIGENRGGQWWGGFFGWTGRYSVWMMFHALGTATEAAWLLSRDPKYLAFYRSQVDYLLDRAIERDGDLLVPHKMGPEGWYDFRPLDPYVVGNLWHLSMDPGDWATLERLYAGARHGPHAYAYAESPEPPAPGAEEWRPDGPADWHRVHDHLTGNKFVENEPAHLRWLAGDNPDWPEAALAATSRHVATCVERLRAGDWEHEWRSQTVTAQNPVLAGVLAQMTMGAPFQGFNGGLLVARVRYFDPARRRPGLPDGVAALVERLSAERTVLQLVNTADAERRVIIQAGGYGEHAFADVAWEDARAGGVDEGRTEVGDRYLEVVLPAGACTRLQLGMRSNVNPPTYAFPEGIGTTA